ncbi:hypothetical protein HIM_09528 [Hirsutella minnesotensis 3608]|uniref:FAD-binding domain-containing protein n=1 Tax=Hirsutella minnesotensis 3608 TaxID=1043627 RepID=A0A0F8A329_9HYPO|nr:hypothetical protein HIM_09528 [Hirsutella minnesotensis 3608]
MSEKFKVLIVGGSIAGLTLAHCLEKLGISYEILEQGDDICPQVGASVGILPNGAPVLDQLGLFDDIEKVIQPLEFARIRYRDGFFFESQYPNVLRARFGYPLAFLERQKFLAILYDRLNGKDRIQTGQGVVSIEDRGDRVVAKTTDGKEHWGHLAVGADGVHSIVRSELWRHANNAQPGRITSREMTALRVDYACVYGISSGVPGVQGGIQLSLLDNGVTIHVFNGKNRKVYWFVIVKTDRRYAYTDRPRFTTDDARKVCDDLKLKKLDDSVGFGDIWANCDAFTMTPLEEGWFNIWHFGRMVCIGDAVRKITPNIGQGANMAIEDAAALANALWRGDLDRAMADTAVMHDLVSAVSATRLARTNRVCRQSEFLTRLQANNSLFKSLLGRYVLPALHDIPAGSSAAVVAGTQLLAFVDPPARALRDMSWWTWLNILRAFAPKLHVLILVGAAALIAWLGVQILTWIYMY